MTWLLRAALRAVLVLLLLDGAANALLALLRAWISCH